MLKIENEWKIIKRINRLQNFVWTISKANILKVHIPRWRATKKVLFFGFSFVTPKGNDSIDN